ncbi:MAG: SPOR domain-containing protein [Balneolaceae bacterium]
MKIEKSKLTERLVEKSGLASDEVEKHLKVLTGQIHKTVEKGKALEVKGLGLFYHSEDLELLFEPAEEFATEVNYQYAGMEPVEVETGRPSSRSTAAKQEPYDLASAGVASEKSEEKGSKSSVKQGKSGKSASKKAKKAAPGRKSAAGTPSPSRRRVAKSEKDSIMNLVYTVITIAVLAVTLIYVLDLNESGPGPEPSASEEAARPEQPAESMPAPDGSGESSSETAVGASSTEEGSDEEAEAPSLEEPVPLRYGLMGETIELEGRYYTIVLHSMSQKLRAEEEAGRLRDNGYRDVLYQVDSEDHGTMWRVGIGQFETIEKAQQAAEELDRPFFVGRIQ